MTSVLSTCTDKVRVLFAVAALLFCSIDTAQSQDATVPAPPVAAALGNSRVLVAELPTADFDRKG